MKTEVTELLGIEYPIIQGGMAWVAEYHLAAGLTEMCSCTLQHSDSSRMYLMRQSRK